MVHTHFVDISVEADWSVRIRRGGHKLSCGLSTSFVLANEVVEFGLDAEQKVFIRPLMVVKETLIKKDALSSKIILASTSNKDEDPKNAGTNKKTNKTPPKYCKDITTIDKTQDIKTTTSGPFNDQDKTTTDPKTNTKISSGSTTTVNHNNPNNDHKRFSTNQNITSTATNSMSTIASASHKPKKH